MESSAITVSPRTDQCDSNSYCNDPECLEASNFKAMKCFLRQKEGFFFFFNVQKAEVLYLFSQQPKLHYVPLLSKPHTGKKKIVESHRHQQGEGQEFSIISEFILTDLNFY